jgi:hypothetical protein
VELAELGCREVQYPVAGSGGFARGVLPQCELDQFPVTGIDGKRGRVDSVGRGALPEFRGHSGEHGETGDDGPRPADTSDAGDFDPVTGPRALVHRADPGDSVLTVTGEKEVRLVDPVVWPGQRGVVLTAHPAAAQV